VLKLPPFFNNLYIGFLILNMLLLSSHSCYTVVCHCIEILSTVMTQKPNILAGVNSSIVQQLVCSAKIWKVYSRKGKRGTRRGDLGVEIVMLSGN